MRLYIFICCSLLIFSSLFISSEYFVDGVNVTKWYSFVILSLFLSFCILCNVKEVINVDFATLIIYFAISYLLVRMLFDCVTDRKIISLISFIYLFSFFRYSYIKLDFIISIAFFLLVVNAFSELFVLKRIPVKGFFDNPAGFSVCLSSIFPIVFMYLEKRYLKILILILSFLSLVIVQSRSGLFSLCISLILLTNLKLKIKHPIIFYFIIFTVLLYLLAFCFKSDSSIGRYYIWILTCKIISDNFIFGHGYGSFKSFYMNYQADYFASSINNEFSMLADNVGHPFNEYLLLSVENGVVSIIFLLMMFVLMMRKSRVNINLNANLISIISIASFSLFSYPLHYSFISILIAYNIAVIIRENEWRVFFRIKLNCFFVMLILLFTLLSITFTVNDIKFEYKWRKISQQTLLGINQNILLQYHNMYKHWNGNPYFLYNYALVLYRNAQYEKSNKILMKCERFLNDYDIQLLIAKNYFELKDWCNSEQKFILSSNMCPNRFIPLYYLLQIYEQIDQKEKALKTATIILNKPIKVPSRTIDNILKEVKLKYFCNVSK